MNVGPGEKSERTREYGAARILDKADLARSGTAYEFEGHRHGGTNVSFIMIDAPPGSGPRPHKHLYEEVFVVQKDDVTFTVGEDTIEASAGQIVVVPAGVPHKFVNSGTGQARHIDIHASRRMTTEWLEKGETGG